MTPLEFVLQDLGGRSSYSLLAVLTHSNLDRMDLDLPYDIPDFGRCAFMLKVLPELKSELVNVPKALPEWGPIVAKWDYLVEEYDRYCAKGKLDYDSFMQILRPVLDECREIQENRYASLPDDEDDDLQELDFEIKPNI